VVAGEFQVTVGFLARLPPEVWFLRYGLAGGVTPADLLVTRGCCPFYWDLSRGAMWTQPPCSPLGSESIHIVQVSPFRRRMSSPNQSSSSMTGETMKAPTSVGSTFSNWKRALVIWGDIGSPRRILQLLGSYVRRASDRYWSGAATPPPG